MTAIQQLILQCFVIEPEAPGVFLRWQVVKRVANWRIQNPGKREEHDRNWRKNNLERERLRSREKRSRLGPQEIARRQRRLETDVEFRMRFRLRNRLWYALRGRVKSARTLELLGCPVPSLLSYLETKFKDGMTWENYGPVWHVDHIRPCASFDLTDPAQQRECFHYTNLQPLFALENLQKGDRYFKEITGR